MHTPPFNSSVSQYKMKITPIKFTFSIFMMLAWIIYPGFLKAENFLSLKIKSEIYKQFGEYKIIKNKGKNNYLWRIKNIKYISNPRSWSPNTIWLEDCPVKVAVFPKKNIEAIGYFWEGKGENYLEYLLLFGKNNQERGHIGQILNLRFPTDRCSGPWNLIIVVKKNDTLLVEKKKVGVLCGSNG